jgi:formylglycine-generating enzyme required for sulfatase activity
MNGTLVADEISESRIGEDEISPMRIVPGGSFQMGSVSGGESERPVHEVFLDTFEMDVAPVTNHQFNIFANETHYQTMAQRNGGAWGFDGMEFRAIAGLSWLDYATPDRMLHPVVLVSWDDARAYAKWARKRLPTEAEWEKAARGGSMDCVYPWGQAEPDGTQCNFARQPGKVPPTSEVGKFSPNSYGFYDMVGNVWQWCNDWYSELSYVNSSPKNPTGPKNGSLRVRRGGAWNVIQAFRLRCSNRGAIDPNMAVPNLGFRCARCSKDNF